MSSKIIYALHKVTAQVVYINNAERGSDCNCICAKCSCDMIAVKGEINDWHFRHKVESDCSGGLETAIHKLAKQIIHENNYIKIKHENIAYYNVRIEERFEIIQPDVTISANGENIYIEIFVSNKKKENHIAFYKTRELKSFEINLSDIPFDISPEELKVKVLEDISNRNFFF